jgi:hypothetical protein
MPITEVLEGGWPWLALWPAAMGLAWRQRQTPAGRWCLGTTLLTAALVLPLRTQLPWYSLLLWPPLLLACGPVLAWLVERTPALTPPGAGFTRRVPAFWALVGVLLCGGGVVAAVSGGPALAPLVPVAVCGGAGLSVGGACLLAEGHRRRRVGAALLIAGLWGALLALFSGPLWLWELNERWPVVPIAKEVRRRPEGAVRLWRLEERPSLNWYADQRVRPWDDDSNKGEPPPFLFTLEAAPPQLSGARCVPIPLTGPPPGARPPAPTPRLLRCTPSQRATTPPSPPEPLDAPTPNPPGTP